MKFSFNKNRSEEKDRIFVKNLIKDVIIFIIMFFIVIIIFQFIKFPKISGDSMQPTFYDGETTIALVTKDVKFNDIVILWSDEINDHIIKRVIGVAGDHIEIENGRLYRNGVMLYEGYINEQLWDQNSVSYNLIVPENEIFVMGDNRNYSTDSRVLGTISVDRVEMKVLMGL